MEKIINQNSRTNLQPQINKSLVEFFNIAAAVADVLPEAILFGGLACSLYSTHRKPSGIHFGMTGLKSRLHDVCKSLQSVRGWHQKLEIEPTAVVGTIGRYTVGIHQLHQSNLVNSVIVKTSSGTVKSATFLELLISKAFLAYELNSLSEYIDFAGLADRTTLENAVNELAQADTKLTWEKQPALLLNIIRSFLHCNPWDSDENTHKHIEWLCPKLSSWQETQAKCREVAALLCHKVFFDIRWSGPTQPMTMKHRHIIADTWSLAAIDSLFDRGTLEDWKKFAGALTEDFSLIRPTERVCEFRNADGSERIARIIIKKVQTMRES